MLLPKIYPITDTKLSGLPHLKQTEKLIDGGAVFVQLREKHASPVDFFQAVKSTIEKAKSRSVKIIINDRVDIALAARADGVHLGQDDLPPAKVREILGDKAIIGFSTHTVQQAIEALELPIDYIAIGPIFATNTKEHTDDIVGLEGLKKVREAINDFPLVAIGGINFGNFHQVFKAGADSVAMISEIISDPEHISQTYERFLLKAGE